MAAREERENGTGSIQSSLSIIVHTIRPRTRLRDLIEFSSSDTTVEYSDLSPAAASRRLPCGKGSVRKGFSFSMGFIRTTYVIDCRIQN